MTQDLSLSREHGRPEKALDAPGFGPARAWLLLWLPLALACSGGASEAGGGSAACSEDAECEDSHPCTVDRCVSGVCLRDPQPTRCDDQNPCTRDACDLAKGCVHLPDLEGVACEAGDACRADSRCTDGACVGTAKACDDQLPCTTDACDPVTGECSHGLVPDGLACDDADPCTSDDACQAGHCVGAAACQCIEDDDCAGLDDGNPCTGTWRCDAAGACVVDADTVVHCDTSEDGPCELTACDTTTGLCEAVAVHEDEACDSGDPCALEERCTQGSCDALSTVACDDGEVCTSDACDSATGLCRYEAVPEGSACDDSDACSQSDACDGLGACVGSSVVDCDDGSPCTDDYCNPENGSCVRLNWVDGSDCDDGDVCTDGDRCSFGVCIGGQVVENCCLDDADCVASEPCSEAHCDDAHSCQQLPLELCCGNGLVEPEAGEDCEAVEGQPAGLCDAACHFGVFEPPGLLGRPIDVALGAADDGAGGLQIAIVEELGQGDQATRRVVLLRLSASGQPSAPPLVLTDPNDPFYRWPDAIDLTVAPAKQGSLVPVTFAAWTEPAPPAPWSASPMAQEPWDLSRGAVSAAAIWGALPYIDRESVPSGRVAGVPVSGLGVQSRLGVGGIGRRRLSLLPGGVSGVTDASAYLVDLRTRRQDEVGSWSDYVAVAQRSRLVLAGSAGFSDAPDPSGGALEAVAGGYLPPGESGPGFFVDDGLERIAPHLLRFGARIAMVYVERDRGDADWARVALMAGSGGSGDDFFAATDAPLTLYETDTADYHFYPAALTSADGMDALVYLSRLATDGSFAARLDVLRVNHAAIAAPALPAEALAVLDGADGVGLRYEAQRLDPTRVALGTVRYPVDPETGPLLGNVRIAVAIVSEDATWLTGFEDLGEAPAWDVPSFDLAAVPGGGFAAAWIEEEETGARSLRARFAAPQAP